MAQNQLTVAQVIEMFGGLGLPVTDDERQVQTKIKELQSRYLREKGDADPQRRHRADLWFKTANRLRTDRAALLDVVRNHFAELADASTRVKRLLENAICLGEVYREARQELSAQLQATKRA